jgi:hypothetical protein
MYDLFKDNSQYKNNSSFDYDLNTFKNNLEKIIKEEPDILNKVFINFDDRSGTPENILSGASNFNSNFPSAATATAGNKGVLISNAELMNKNFNTIINTITDSSYGDNIIYSVLSNILQSIGISQNQTDRIIGLTFEDLIYLIDITKILNDKLNKPSIPSSASSMNIPSLPANDFILQFINKDLTDLLESTEFKEIPRLEGKIDVESVKEDVYQPLKLRVHQALNYYFINKYYSIPEASGYNIDEYILSLYKNKSITLLSDDDDDDDDFFNVDEGTDTKTRVYFRRNGNLYKIDDNGKEIQIDNDYTVTQMEKDRCKASGLNEKDQYRCNNYIQKCLNGQDLDGCRDFLNNDSTTFIAADEVKNMPPELIIQTIDRLQLRKKDDYDSDAKMMITRLEPFHVWIKYLETNGKFSADDCQKIDNHKTLKTYISTLINWVNTEIAILNPGYKGTQELDDKIRSNAFKGTRLYNYGLRVRSYQNSDNDSLVEQVTNLIRDEKIRSINTIQLNGGGLNINELYYDNTKRTSEMLGKTYLRLKTILESQGKQIEESQHKKIEKYIQDLKNSESIVIKTNYFIQEYLKLYNNLGEDESTNLKLGYVKKFVEAQNSKIERTSERREKISLVLKSLKDLIK